MDKNIFITRKHELQYFLQRAFNESKNQSIAKALEILSQYNFDNRLMQKGALTRYTIDSAEFDYSIGERIIEFDKSITE